MILSVFSFSHQVVSSQLRVFVFGLIRERSEVACQFCERRRFSRRKASFGDYSLSLLNVVWRHHKKQISRSVLKKKRPLRDSCQERIEENISVETAVSYPEAITGISV